MSIREKTVNAHRKYQSWKISSKTRNTGNILDFKLYRFYIDRQTMRNSFNNA